MGVRAYGDDFSALFTVTAKQSGTGMQILKPVADAPCIDFQTDPVFQKQIQHFFKQIRIFFVRIILILGRRVTDHIVQMPVDIKISKGFQILYNGRKIFTERFFFSFFLPRNRADRDLFPRKGGKSR